MNTSTPVLVAEDLGKTFHGPAEIELFKKLSFVLHAGETAAISGRSGEGKTTLLHILGTLEAPSSGKLSIAGQEVSWSNTAALRNESLGFIFQSFHLLEHYTALENILMPARIARSSVRKGSHHFEKAMDLLEKVGMMHRKDFPVKLLSGGEKQRVALARSLINDPAILFADEPTGNLDRQTSLQVQEFLFNCVKEQGTSLVIVTHDEQLAALCQKQTRLEGGFLTSN
jgi:lipoprotein-releasing system ATP-binding protein